MRDHALRQPAVDERAERLLLHAAGRAAVEHAAHRRATDLGHELRRLLERVDERRLLARKRLDAVNDPGLGRVLGDRGKAVTRAGHRRGACLARIDAPLVRRAVHEIASAELGALVDEREHHVDGLLAHRRVLAADGKARRLDQQPVQAGDLDSRLACRGARRGDLPRAHAVRLVGERVGRDFQAVVAKLRRVLALPRKRQLGDDLVAERDAHQRLTACRMVCVICRARPARARGAMRSRSKMRDSVYRLER